MKPIKFICLIAGYYKHDFIVTCNKKYQSSKHHLQHIFSIEKRASKSRILRLDESKKQWLGVSCCHFFDISMKSEIWIQWENALRPSFETKIDKWRYKALCTREKIIYMQDIPISVHYLALNMAGIVPSKPLNIFRPINRLVELVFTIDSRRTFNVSSFPFYFW